MFPKLHVLIEGLETGRNIRSVCKNKTQTTLSIPLIIRTLSKRNQQWRANVSLYIFQGTAEGILEVEVHVQRIYPRVCLNSSAFELVELSFSVPVDI